MIMIDISQQILSKLRQFKWFLKTLIDGELPLSNIHKIMTPLEEWKECQNKKIVFTAWKTKWITKSHFFELEEFVKTNLDWTFVFIDRKSELKWMQDQYSQTKILDIYLGAKFGATKSDIFRYCVLERYGGAFFSINFSIRNISLTNLFNDSSKFVISQTSMPVLYISPFSRFESMKKYMGTSFVMSCIISPKNHPILKNAIAFIEDRANLFDKQRFTRVDEAIWWLTGPHLFTDAILKYIYSYTDMQDDHSTLVMSKDFNKSLHRSHAAKYRYMFGASYIGFKNQVILKL